MCPYRLINGKHPNHADRRQPSISRFCPCRSLNSCNLAQILIYPPHQHSIMQHQNPSTEAANLIAVRQCEELEYQYPSRVGFEPRLRKGSDDTFIDPLRKVTEVMDSKDLMRLGVDTGTRLVLRAEARRAWVAQQEKVQRLLPPAHATRSKKRKYQAEKARATARHEVFTTTELLEHILLQLPPKDLLFAEQICKDFGTVMRGSVKIQRALFFQPEPLTKKGGARSVPIANPFLDPKFFPGRSLIVVQEQRTGGFVYLRGVRHVQTTSQHCDERGRPTHQAILSLRSTKMSSLKRIWLQPKIEKIHINGSWRRMYFTQPPCPVLVSTHGDGASSSQYHRQSLPVGRLMTPLWQIGALSMSMAEFERVLELRWKRKQFETCLNALYELGELNLKFDDFDLLRRLAWARSMTIR